MIENLPSEEELRKKKARKAQPGGFPKLINIPRNWAHQALRYMDTGELSVRILVELTEVLIIWFLLLSVFAPESKSLMLMLSVLIVHTWNWITNGLFWSVIIFSFPNLRNPGARNTVDYLNNMRERLIKRKCISGIAVYGSVTRGAWHDRSDIDIRLLRQPGISALCCAAWITMQERFSAFVHKQPMDMFLADDIDFLGKMRSDEIPLLLLCRDKRLQNLYPSRMERPIELSDLLGKEA